MWLAAQIGCEEVVKLLLAREDTDVNSRDRDGRAALLAAAGNGHEAIVRQLVAGEEIDVNSRDSRG